MAQTTGATTTIPWANLKNLNYVYDGFSNFLFFQNTLLALPRPTQDTSCEFGTYNILVQNLGEVRSPSGIVSVGSFNVPLKIKFDYENAETYFKSNAIRFNPFNTEFERLYNPRDSSEAVQID